MGILTVLRFLIGQRQAILDIAASRHAIWLGLLFVLSAGFAREYDGEDLLHEPWHLLLPLMASLSTSTILFTLMWLTLHGWRTMPNEWRTYQSFVSLYWMTAPLAWIYAIPVERMFDAGRATQANLWFLGIVAVWRVVLMIRVVSVIFQAPVVRVIFPFMLFADGVLLALLRIAPVPILAVMGGVRLSQSEQIIAVITFLATALGMVSLPIWGIGTVITLFMPRHAERVASLAALPGEPIRATLWFLAAAALMVWALVLPFTQPEQQRRWEVERFVTQGNYNAALQYMAKFEQSDFPVYWDPPPRIAFHDHPSPHVLDALDAIAQIPNPPAWLTKTYHRKFEDHFENYYGFWEELSDRDFDRLLTWMERIPLDDNTLGHIGGELRVYLESESSEDKKRTLEQRQRLWKALKFEDDLPVTPVEDVSSGGETTPAGEPMPTSAPNQQEPSVKIGEPANPVTPPSSAETPQTAPPGESKDAENGAAPPEGTAADQ